MDADLEDVLSDEEQLEPVAQAQLDADEEDVEAELFGSDDEPAAPVSAADAAAERKRTLQELAKKAAAEQEGGKASKKSKKDKGREREREGGRRGSGSSTRQRQERGAGEAGEERGVEVGLLEDDVDNIELVATAEDEAFIDDEGVPEGEEAYGSEEEDEADRLRRIDQAQEEGEEEAEEGSLAAVLAARKRRKLEDDVDRRVQELIGMLNASAEADEECLTARPRRPAIHKLQQLKNVEETLRQVKYREPFIYAHGLAALNRWLVPYEDGTCPALKVRSTVLKLLAQLPIDASQEGMQDELATSGVGKSVAFYSKKTDEPADNRKLALSLYQRWAGAMLYNREAEAAKRERRREEHKARLEAERELRQQREQEERRAAQLRLTATRNDPHYRPRAAVPSAGKMDYVVNPNKGGGSRLSEGEEEAPRPSPVRRPGGGGNSLAQFEKKKKAASQRAGRHDKVSIEGRGLTLRGA